MTFSLITPIDKMPYLDINAEKLKKLKKRLRKRKRQAFLKKLASVQTITVKPSEQFDDSFNILRIDFDGFKEEEQKTLRLVGSFGFSHFLDRNAFYRFRGKPFERQKGFWNGEDMINIDSRINLTRYNVKSIIDGAIHLDGYYRIFLICGNQKVCIRDGKKNRKFIIEVDESDIYGNSITLLRNSIFHRV